MAGKASDESSRAGAQGFAETSLRRAPLGCHRIAFACCLKDFSIVKPHLFFFFFLDGAQESEIIKYIIMKASACLLKY